MRSSVDILFANEAEIASLYEANTFEDAARRAQSETKLAAITRSEKGSVILSGGRTIEVAAAPVAKVVDTTGAGDLYAAGFLYGVASGRDLETAGRLGSLAAAEVISHVGARPQMKLAELARKGGASVTRAYIRRSATLSMRWSAPLRRIRRARWRVGRMFSSRFLRVDRAPDLQRLVARVVGREMRVAVEVGGRIAEGGLAQAHEARDVPLLDHLRSRRRCRSRS